MKRFLSSCYGLVDGGSIGSRALQAIPVAIIMLVGTAIITAISLVLDFLTSTFLSKKGLKLAGYWMTILIGTLWLLPNVNVDYLYGRLKAEPTTGPHPTACLEEYNIRPYATAKNHENNIEILLLKMGFMDSADEISRYIQEVAPGSPVTGEMVWSSSIKHSVDRRLMMAIMHLDSHFGTKGKGARTRNPGNVGNDDSDKTVVYPTWEDGVEAVAIWLKKHRKIISSAKN